MCRALQAFAVGLSLQDIWVQGKSLCSCPLHAGVYADLDFEALRNIEPLLEGQKVVLAAMSKDMTPSSHPETYEHAIPNAWMASVRHHHPFWMFALAEMMKMAGQNNTKRCAPGLPLPW